MFIPGLSKSACLTTSKNPIWGLTRDMALSVCKSRCGIIRCIFFAGHSALIPHDSSIRWSAFTRAWTPLTWTVCSPNCAEILPSESSAPRNRISLKRKKAIPLFRIAPKNDGGPVSCSILGRVGSLEIRHEKPSTLRLLNIRLFSPKGPSNERFASTPGISR